MATRVLALTDPGCEASTRYRVVQFENHFRARGVILESQPWPRELTAQLALLDTLADVDAVIVQRILPKSWMLRRLRQRANRLVYDFDDAVIYSESTHRRARLKLSRWWKFHRMMRCCDAVTAGSNYLAALARKHGGGARVYALPTVLEFERYDRESAGSPAGPVLGWIGGRWTLPYLEQLREPLERLSDEFPDMTLRVIADQRPNLGRTRVELVPWDAASEVRELKRLCVGLAPLPDDNWTRGKCGLRLLQYLASGIPAVASPVGTQADITRVGAALPASSTEDWIRTLRQLLTDQELADRLADRGRELVRESFSVSNWSELVRTMWCGPG